MEFAREKTSIQREENRYWKMCGLTINTISIFQFFSMHVFVCVLPCGRFLILTKMTITKYLLLKANL